MAFCVSAGKYDDGERNFKYTDEFLSLEEAIAAREKVSSYPWSEITFRDGDYVYSIEPVRVLRMRPDSAGVHPRFDVCLPDGNFL